MKRLLLVLALALTTTSCTAEEVRFWNWYNAGQPSEDSDGWNCETMGNGICGTNP